MLDLQQARAHHLAGRLAEAEAAYRDAVAADPGHAEAWHLLGVIAYQTGRFAEAEALIGNALKIGPHNPDFLSNLGLVCRALGRPKEAVRHCRAALAARPDHAAAHGNLGVALRELGRRKEAEAEFRRAVALDPAQLDAMNNLGNLLREEGRLDEAERILREALVRDPTFVEAAVGLGLVMQARRRPELAEDLFRQALALRPEFAAARLQLGNALWAQARVPEAEQACREAIAADPGSAHAYNNLGLALAAQGRLEEAEASLRSALALAPEFADAYSNLGSALRDQGRLEDARAMVEQALALAPGNAGAHLNDAMLRLLQGDYAAGWRALEWRWKDPDLWPDMRRFPGRRWQGKEDLRGKTVLLHAEQGLGDTVQFARFVPLVAARGARVLFEVQPALAAALYGMPGVERLVAASAQPPDADFHCPLMSLPRALGVTLETLPAAVPYVPLDAGAVAAWRGKLSAGGQRLVGLCWKGNPRNRLDRLRSLRLADALPLLEAPGVRFVSLQEDLDEEERALVAGRGNFVHERLPFKDKAELAGALDLVISVDTVWAHWAGAIARPLWVLLPSVPPWTWLLGRDDSPWYPTARLFRQAQRGDWAGVVSRAARELASAGSS
jgi:Flp pilus assembly protein TadD